MQRRPLSRISGQEAVGISYDVLACDFPKSLAISWARKCL